MIVIDVVALVIACILVWILYLIYLHSAEVPKSEKQEFDETQKKFVLENKLSAASEYAFVNSSYGKRGHLIIHFLVDQQNERVLFDSPQNTS